MRIKDNTNLYEILDSLTGEWVTYLKTTIGYDGTTITSSNESTYIDNVIYIKLTSANGGGYAKRVLPESYINIKWFNLIGDGVTDEFIKLKDSITLSGLMDIPLMLPIGINISLGQNTLTIPENVTLIFKGGTIVNGTIIGTQTKIIAPNRKIFSTNVTLAGTFNMDYICPQHFGAITNQDNTVFENNCSAEIQACIDAPINTYLPQGAYYISSGFIFDKPKNFTLCGKFSNNDENIIDHATIYTDQNINPVTIQAGQVYIKGGTFDMSPCTAFTNDVIRYDLNYPMWGGEIDTKLFGSRTGMLTAGIGGNGIRFDQSNITETGGYAVFMKFNLQIDYFYKGVKSDVKVGLIFINSLEFNLHLRSIKQFLDIQIGLSDSHFFGFFQCDANLIQPGEETIYPIYMGGFSNYIDGVVFDPDLQPVIHMAGYNNTIGPRLQQYYESVNKFNEFYNIKTAAILSPNRSYIPRMRVNSKNGMIISKLDTETIGLDKTSTVTINAYKGATIDFDTDLDDTSFTLSPTSDITINNPNNFWNFGVEPNIFFTTAADLDNDFVEIVITAGSLPHQWLCFYLFLSQETNNCFKRIQLIDHNTDGSTSVFNIYPTQPTYDERRTYIFEAFESKTSNKTILRFIGNTLAESDNIIISIDAVRNVQRNVPYIHILGGQTIYGALTTTQYKLSALNTAPASAAATGVLGEVRIDANHIYVCTATNTWKRVAIATW